MAVVPPRPRRSRPRRGSLERPVNGRLYRGTWLLVSLPLLLAAFTVARPVALPPPSLPPAFNGRAALELAQELSTDYPDRSPGTQGAAQAADWYKAQLSPYGLNTEVERFRATIPGLGTREFQNLITIVPGQSQEEIVVAAHRDNLGVGAGANDNASGTGALIELARSYAQAPLPSPSAPAPVRPTHTLVFLSTDGGAFGAIGADEFATASPYRHGAFALIDLDSIAGRGPPRLQIAANTARSPADSLVQTASARIAEQAGLPPGRPPAWQQLLTLAFPYSLYEQGPVLAHGIPALTLTTAGDVPPATLGDTPHRLNGTRLTVIGRSTQQLLGSLDQGLDLAQGTTSYVYLGQRIVRGWAIELVLVAMLLPFLVATVDLFAHCRRRRIPLAPALRSLRSRIGFWLFVGAVFAFLVLVGAFPRGVSLPVALETSAARHWPILPLAVLGVLAFVAWLVVRVRLAPRRRARPEEELAGHTGALLGLGVVALLAVATNPFTLIFLLPSLHAWLWIPQARSSTLVVRLCVLAIGLVGPALLLGWFGLHYGLGLDAPWYLTELLVVGFVSPATALVALGWLAVAWQLGALATGRYAPYPSVSERPPRGPIRETIRRVVLASRRRRGARLRVVAG
ncbi:MAG TPA: M28 family peptidase [Gaiellaceae bacterium]|nr:M28 family peptidase [Gaiellaceae bacterium]